MHVWPLNIGVLINNKNFKSSHMASTQALWVMVDVGCGVVRGRACTVCRVCNVVAVACSCDTIQMCRRTQTPVDLACSWKGQCFFRSQSSL